jgi:hypothetical protein
VVGALLDGAVVVVAALDVVVLSVEVLSVVVLSLLLLLLDDALPDDVVSWSSTESSSAVPVGVDVPLSVDPSVSPTAVPAQRRTIASAASSASGRRRTVDMRYPRGSQNDESELYHG